MRGEEKGKRGEEEAGEVGALCAGGGGRVWITEGPGSLLAFREREVALDLGVQDSAFGRCLGTYLFGCWLRGPGPRL